MQDHTKKLWAKVERWSWIFNFCPYLQEVYVVNSLALNKVRSTSDIDLFITTEPERVLEVRFYLTVIMDLLGLRVHGNKRAGRFCLSFIVDSLNADLEKVMFKVDPLLDDFLKNKKNIYKRGSLEKRHFATRLLVAFTPKFLLRWHIKKSMIRARQGHFKNPSIIISRSVFKFHENDARHS